MPEEIKTHPVQSQHCKPGARVPEVVTKAAYEVYCEVYSPQESLITGWCRGGFGVDELIGFLYARSFPKNEWEMRYKEACNGMKNL